VLMEGDGSLIGWRGGYEMVQILFFGRIDG